MFQNYTLNSIVMMLLGVGLIGWGAYNGWEYRRSITSMFVFPTVVGFILSGLAAMLCGYTNGFTDHSPRGRMLKKIGIFLAVGGLPIMGYAIWRSL